MAARRTPSPPNARQDEAQKHRRTLQRLLSSLAVHLPAHQPSFQSAFLLEFNHAAQAHVPRRHKGA